MIVTFCGHAHYTESKEDERKILAFLTEKVGDGDASLYLGGYGEFDAFARKCGRKFQETHPRTQLIFITPYITPEYQKNHLAYKQDLYDGILYAGLENVPQRFAISRRNKWMAERADYVIAYIDHAWGGAYQTYLHAKRRGKHIFNITSKDL